MGKTCYRCGETKPEEEFFKKQKKVLLLMSFGGISLCIDCETKRALTKKYTTRFGETIYFSSNRKVVEYFNEKRKTNG